MDAANVRREFRRALHLVPGLEPTEWTPREMRRSFVSVLSDAGVPLEEISRLVGHSFRLASSVCAFEAPSAMLKGGPPARPGAFTGPGARRCPASRGEPPGRATPGRRSRSTTAIAGGVDNGRAVGPQSAAQNYPPSVVAEDARLMADSHPRVRADLAFLVAENFPPSACEQEQVSDEDSVALDDGNP